MTDQSTTEVIPWYKSATIWSALVSAVCGVAAITGHSVDLATQTQLVVILTNVASTISVAAAFAAAHFRTKTNATIQPIIKKGPPS